MSPNEQLQLLADIRFAADRPECLAALTDREHGIFWALHVEPRLTTRQDLAKAYGVSRERIRVLERDALAKIRIFREQDLRRCTHCGGRGWVEG